MLDFIWAVVAFILVLAPLVFIHEFGHFLAAKMFGIGVPVFSLGFGPRLLGFRRAETDYRLSAIPLGGYVRLAGDESDENRTGAPDEFLSRPRYQRFVVFVAGATFNIILAFLALWFYFGVYGKAEAVQIYPSVAQVPEGSAAEQAGIRPKDKIISIAGRDVKDAQEFLDAYLLDVKLAPETLVPLVLERDGQPYSVELPTGRDAKDGSGDLSVAITWEGDEPAVLQSINPGDPAEKAGLETGDTILAAGEHDPITRLEFQLLIRKSGGQPVDLRVGRGDELLEITVIPREEEGRGGWIGVGFRQPESQRVRLGVGGAAMESLRTNVALSQTLFIILKRLVTGRVSTKTLSGPIGIAQVAKQALFAGAEPFLWLLGFFSLQLGILNLLPIPVLDGGHILILFVEGILRRDLSERLKERVMQVGFVFLLAFMSLIIFQDVLKSF
jgi:regulator of sigma E protease